MSSDEIGQVRGGPETVRCSVCGETLQYCNGQHSEGNDERWGIVDAGDAATASMVVLPQQRRSIVPLRDRVLVRRIEVEEVSGGGLFIPDVSKEKPQEAEVVAVGGGKIADSGAEVPLLVRVGDRVLFGRFGGHELKVDGEAYTILREDEVLAVLR